MSGRIAFAQKLPYPILVALSILAVRESSVSLCDFAPHMDSIWTPKIYSNPIFIWN